MSKPIDRPAPEPVECCKGSDRAQTAIPASAADRAVSDLLRHVGAGVRLAREGKGLSRRVLSEASGVSPRYLAQLESGGGNISIGLLSRVAIALDHRIEWFFGARDPAPFAASRANRICLLGLRGAGKSTLGRMAGAALGVPFVELNREIEDLGGIEVDEVMALYGPEGYRKLESQALSRVIGAFDRVILAVAGGVVSEPETYAALLENFHTIWLRASPEDHMARVRAQGDERPMAGNPEAMQQLRQILTSRESQYEKALAQLDTSSTSPEASLAQLLTLVAERDFLN